MIEANLEELIPDPRNANRGSERGYGMLNKSLQNLGAGRSIVCDKNNVVIAGNKTLQAAVDAGLTDALIVETNGNQVVVVRRTDLDLERDEKAKQLAIADNRTSEFMEWDAVILSELAMEVDLGDYFTDSELAALLPDIEEPEEGEGDKDPDDVPPDVKVIRANFGDIWQLGMHRLLVGDATMLANFGLLLGTEQADMLWTDPPYNVNYDAESRKVNDDKNYLAKRKVNPLGGIANDNMSDADFLAFLKKAFANINQHLKPGHSIYIAHAELAGLSFRSAFASVKDWHQASCLLWVKNRFALSRADYQWMHEPILYGWKKGATHRWFNDRAQTTLLEHKVPHYDKELDTGKYIHPSQKPVSLIKECISNSSEKGDIILDVFGGSGSTLIACQETGRRGYLMELEPKHATAIIERYEAFTGDVATKING